MAIKNRMLSTLFVILGVLAACAKAPAGGSPTAQAKPETKTEAASEPIEASVGLLPLARSYRGSSAE